MSSKTLLGIVITIIIIVAGWLLINRKSALAPTPTASPSASALESPTPAASPTGELTTIPQGSPSASPLLSPTPAATGTGTPLPPLPRPTSHEVSITSEGFSPTTLNITVGDTVTFVNRDTDPHWPASTPHPVHTDVPGFDALHGLATNETYSFTFTEVRTVTYHDHLNPSVRGTIVVQFGKI
ncbi:MAG: hypothetical protein HY459_02755 [Parcubacteria group bacterium]|nr:hypothetical protein [Parcubacteria group bacterium]